MKISSIKKLVVEDFKVDVRETVQRLAQILNPFLDQTVQAIAGNLTLADNFKGKVYDIDLPADTSTYTVAWEINEKPTAVYIGQLTKSDLSAVSAVFALSWKYDNKTINLTFLGLTAGTKHKVKLIGIV